MTTPQSRLLKLADEAVADYNATHAAGGEAVYPSWVEDVRLLCNAAPGVSTVEDAQAVAWMEPGIDVPVTNEYRNKTPLRQAKYCVPLYKHAPVNAPAAGDALDAARYRWLRDESLGVPDGMREIYVIQQRLPHTEGTYMELFDTALDAAVDAALAAQVPQQGEA